MWNAVKHRKGSPSLPVPAVFEQLSDTNQTEALKAMGVGTGQLVSVTSTGPYRSCAALKDG